MNYTIVKEFEFEAAHSLPGMGKCENLHGHSYKLQVGITARTLNKNGVVLDFKALKNTVEALIINDLDHSNLDTKFERPTAEKMAEEIFSKLKGALSVSEIFSISFVRLWETSSSWVEVSE